MTRYAIAPDHPAPYLTPGKRYEATKDSGWSFHIKDDNGEDTFCLKKRCAHTRDSGDWTFEDEA